MCLVGFWLAFHRVGTVAPAPVTSLAPEPASWSAFWPLSEVRRILGNMRKRPRITRFDAAMKLIPPDTVEAIHHFIEAGTLPEPSSGPGGMDAWLETCRQAGAGELKVTRILFPSAAEVAEEDRAAFFARLDEIRAEAERMAASGETCPWRPDVPERPPPWEVDSLTGLARPGSLSDELRKMGRM